MLEEVELLATAQFKRGTEARLSRQFKKETNQDLKAITNILGQKELCFQVKGEYSMRKAMPLF